MCAIAHTHATSTSLAAAAAPLRSQADPGNCLQVEAAYLSDLSPDAVIKKASIFISREARPPSTVATTIVVEAEARLITSTALVACAEASTSDERISILAEASARVEVLVTQSGGNVNISIFVEVIATVTVQVQQNTVRFPAGLICASPRLCACHVTSLSLVPLCKASRQWCDFDSMQAEQRQADYHPPGPILKSKWSCWSVAGVASALQGEVNP